MRFLLILVATMVSSCVEAKHVWHVSQHDLTNKFLEFKGTNHTNVPQIVVVRIDDRTSPNYAQRVNYERTVLPGSFTFHLSTSELYTSNKRQVKPEDIQTIYIFAGNSHANIEFAATTTKPIMPLPEELIAWDFGAPNSKVWPGFERVTPTHPALSGRLTPLQRDSHNGVNDGLISDGIKGIDTLKLPIGPGRYRIHLWLEDMGDWEYTPHFLTRTIAFNDTVLEQINFTPDTWQKQRYLRQPSYSDKPDVFNDIVVPFYGHRSYTLETSSSQNILTLSGDQPASKYLAGLLVEPLGEEKAIDHVTHQQALWWRQNWPITDVLFIPMPVQDINSPITLVMAQDEQQHLAFTYEFAADFNIVRVTEKDKGQMASSQKYSPTMTPRHVNWQLRRKSLQGNLLHFSAQRLSHYPLSEQQTLPSISTLSVATQMNTPARTYHYEVIFTVHGKQSSIPLQVTVLNLPLPKLTSSVGVYLEAPYHRTWLPSLAPNRAYRCDLQRLKSFGLNALSPGLPTPSNDMETKAFLNRLKNVDAAGLNQTILAYAPYKRLVATMGVSAAIAQVQKVDALVRTEFPNIELFWSIADEPSNAASPPFTTITDSLLDITAGHFNAPEDTQWFNSVSAKLVNSSVELNDNDFHLLAQEDSKVYLYNLEQHRHAAGLATWYWQTDGYFQWHARMPSAYPFSPVDAREDDVFFIYPAAELCSTKPDIDWTLLAISQGIYDQRWLQWLTTTATYDLRAAQLITSIQKAIKQQGSPLNVETSTLTQWLIKIKQLANHIHTEASHGSNSQPSSIQTNE